MGDLERLEKTLIALLDDRLQEDVDRTDLLLGEGATLARFARGDALGIMRRPRRWPVMLS